MNTKATPWITLGLAAALMAAPAGFAQQTETKELREQMKSMQERLDELEAKEKEREEAATREKREKGGDFRADIGERIHLHGYGELHYNSHRSSSTIKPGGELPAILDFHRFVWGLRYDFTDKLTFDSEVDFEHATDELELEFAYLEYRFRDAFALRAGSLLLPVGSLNEFHEPTRFHSVERPYFHNFIIPTTWMEGGAGALGTIGDFSYRAYIVAGLSAVKQDADDESQFNPATGIRGGRQRLFNHEKSYAEDLAFAGRLEWKGVEGLRLGGSLYYGGSAQSHPSVNIGSADVTLVEADARYDWKGFQFTGEFATIRVGDADKISAAIGSTMGSRIQGWFLEAAYDVFHAMGRDDQLFVFVRHEDLDTHAKVPGGMAKNPSFDREINTFGVSYKPHHQVALKADVELWEDAAGQSLTRFNLGMAYDF